jgi:signal transduction histidine kinase/HD-like signal output (HDOD) protein
MAATGLQRRKIDVLLDDLDQLPTIPGVGHHVLSLAMASPPSRRELQLATESDASLSARALRLAIELNGSVDSLTNIDAVLNSIPLDVLAADLLSLEIVDPEILREARLPRLWRHILATGMASQVIAARLGTLEPATALLAGIIHDIGQIALLCLMPRAYAQVLARVEASGKDPIEAEHEMFGVDHAVVGKRLAQRWGFPESLQSVAWLHHQAQVPTSDKPGVVTLVQVVRLADLLVRREGFSYHPSEQVRENPNEAAERLGLSGIQAEQIVHNVAAAFALNSGAVGLETDHSPDELRRLLQEANVRLGRLYRAGHSRGRRLESRARRGEWMIRLSTDLAPCHGPRQVLETIAVAACNALGLRVVVPYVAARGGDYVEGVRATAEGGVEEHFLYDITKRPSLEPAPDTASSMAAGVPVRAERLEAWLFERQGAHLGAGPFYTLPMIVEQTRVGGLVFSLSDGPRDLTREEAAELAAIASMAATALKRTLAEADLVEQSEELAEANRQLRSAQERELEQRNVTSMSEMAAGAAHEINNPLAVISGRAQQLAATEQDAPRREMLGIIVQQAGRASDIILELRQFARPPTPVPQTVDPAAVARQVAAALEPLVKAPNIRIQVDAAPATPIRVDPDQVGGAIREVVQNAIEACAEGVGGKITIGVQSLAAEAAVRFIVADDGPGMDPQVRARAFDPFFCGHKAGRHRGLGLPKAYRAVQANGGRMTLESEPGRGTTVRMTFPAAEPKPAGETFSP